METKDLAIILSKRNIDHKYDAIIKRAANNGYHDFKFDTIIDHPEYGECISPKMQLVEDLSDFPELEDISEAVMGGDYDESADEKDELMMQHWLIEDNAPNLLYEVLGFTVPTDDEKSDYFKKKNAN